LKGVSKVLIFVVDTPEDFINIYKRDMKKAKKRKNLGEKIKEL